MIALALVSFGAFAEDPVDIGEVDLADLLAPTATSALDAPTAVASAADLAGRESPGVITVITRQDLLASGARDLSDVLRLVPGFDFGVDVNGVVSVGIRGVWAHEGKWVLLVDGHLINETAYSSVPLGNRFPVDVIDRIEIIRGPGATKYGGNAELGVIRITTVAASESVGATVSARYGRTDTVLDRATLAGGGGTAWDDGRFGAYAVIGEGIRSDGVFDDGYGDTYDLSEQSAMRPLDVSAQLQQGDLSTSVLFTRYGLTSRDGYGSVLSELQKTVFTTVSADVRYEATTGANSRLTPYAKFVYHQPWSSDGVPDDPIYFYRRETARPTVGAEYVTRVRDDIDVHAGTEGYVDLGWGEKSDGPIQQTYANVALFGEGVARLDLATIALGARAEYHTAGGPSFVPRLAVTRVFEQGHLKALAARAFRPPGIENALSDGVRSEFTNVFEVEGGYALGSAQYVTVNLFDQTLHRPIVYFYEENPDGSTAEGYKNFERAGTRGAELQYKLRTGRWSIGANWSMYSAAGKDQVESWAVADRPDRLLGFASRKGVVTVSTNPWRALRFGATGTFASARSAWIPDGAGSLTLGELPPYALIDLSAGTDRIAQRPFGVAFAVRDVLDEAPGIPQPYDGGHAPLPGEGRVYEVRLSWEGLHGR